MDAPEPHATRAFLLQLQNKLRAALEAEDGGCFAERADAGLAEGAPGARALVLEGGARLEKAALLFTHSRGAALPAAASARRPELAGQGFEAVSLSVIVHPQNPYAPTAHMNLRAFVTRQAAAGAAASGWFGGGFDLTPVYGFEEDCVHWHSQARAACAPLGAAAYARFKTQCDQYFVLRHRGGEARGVGGIFFDDLIKPDAAICFEFLCSVGEHFLPAYLPILRRRTATPFGAREREFQLWRRGRYAEFNLLWDRGTRYGIQSGRRVESVLASLPPAAAWRHDYQPPAGSPEAELAQKYLPPRDWLAGAAEGHA